MARKTTARRAIDGGMRMRLAFEDGELKVISVLREEAARVIELPGPMAVYDSSSFEKRIDALAQEIRAEAMRIAQDVLADAYESVANEIEAFADEMQRLDEEASAALDMDLAAAEDWARAEAEAYAGTDAAAEQAEAREAIAKVQYEVDASIQSGIRHMRRDADDVYQQIIDAARDTREAEWDTLRKASKDALDAFADRGVTGFTDRAGRRWGLPEYADMAMRTGIQRAALAATVSSMQRWGMDLCFVNKHMGCCPKCAKWQGVILSLRGTGGHPSLDDAMADGLFHPNCGHVLQVYLEGYSEPWLGVPEGYEEADNADLYARRQRQRMMEREVRRWKRRQAAAASPQDERIAQAHVQLWQKRIREHIGDDVNLPRRYDREGGRVLLSDAAKKLMPAKLGFQQT